MPYPTALAEDLTFLTPDMGLGERADAALADLHEHGFVAAAGLTEYHAGSLAVIAAEPHIVEYCPNDKKRFGTLAATAKWVGKGGGRGMVGIYTVEGNNGEPLSAADIENITSQDVHMVADGWSGYDLNKHIPGADITTAYRSSREGQELARARRNGPEDKFGLGMPLGELVIASGVSLYGVDPRQISLETWDSNEKAVALYERLGFVHRASHYDIRPTLKPVSTEVGDNLVYELDGKHVVNDIRRFYVLGESHPLVAQAA